VGFRAKSLYLHFSLFFGAKRCQNQLRPSTPLRITAILEVFDDLKSLVKDRKSLVKNRKRLVKEAKSLVNEGKSLVRKHESLVKKKNGHWLIVN
jgi:hypothetical protein